MNKQIEKLLNGNNEGLQEVGFIQHFVQGGKLDEMMEFILENYFDKSRSGVRYWMKENFFCTGFEQHLTEKEEYFLSILPRKKDEIYKYLLLIKNIIT